MYDYTFGDEVLHDSCLFIGMQNNQFMIETAMVHNKTQITKPYKWIFEKQTKDISFAEINKMAKKDSIEKLPRVYLIPETFNGKFLRIIYEEPSGLIPKIEKDKLTESVLFICNPKYEKKLLGKLNSGNWSRFE